MLLELRDEELLARVLGGDANAYRELVVRYQSLIFTLCLKMLADREEARDAAQEVFLQAYRSLGEFQGGAQFRSWLYKIAANKCIDIRRKQARRAGIASISPLQEDLPRSADPTPEEQLLATERSRELQAAIDELPEKYRDVVILYHYQRLSYKQIAEILGIEVKSVETRMSRAKKMLRERLRKEEQDDDELARRRSAERISGQ
ncbi:RNA polymerase sigma factor [Effusibacillus pohliae]|uniref:RNA polymerase sigma factor n=1 Tax=Effusibacillus pohliae TaxID=232270 RepID=UPI00037BBE44|nr:sigma-70 family RNA polymerase sigma factor [Effusibacillus pohliae]